MAKVIESINESRRRGVSDEAIMQAIRQANPGKEEMFKKAEERGVSATAVVQKIIQDNAFADSPEPEQKSFMDRVKEIPGALKESFGKRFKKTQEAVEFGAESITTEPRLTGVAEAGLRVAGQAAGLGLDIIADVTSPLFDTLIDKISDNKKFQKFATSEIGDSIEETQNNVIDAYSEFKEENPNAAEDLEATLNIAFLTGARPFKKNFSNKLETAINSTKTRAEKALAKKQLQEAIKITEPRLTVSERQRAIAQGRGKQSKITGEQSITPSAQDIRVAQSVAGIVSEKKNPFQNVQSIRNNVSNIDSQIKRDLTKYNAPSNESQLRSALNTAKQESSIVFGSDKALEKAYDDIVDYYLSLVTKKNNLGLFEARQKFDNLVEQKFPRIFDAGPGDNVRKNAIMDVRRTVNNYVADNVPKDQLDLIAQLSKEHRMLNAIDNIADQSARTIGTTRFTRATSAIRKHPVISSILASAGVLAGPQVIAFLTNPYVMATLLAGGTVKFGTKVLRGRTVKKALIRGLKQMAKERNTDLAGLATTVYGITELQSIIDEL